MILSVGQIQIRITGAVDRKDTKNIYALIIFVALLAVVPSITQVYQKELIVALLAVTPASTQVYQATAQGVEIDPKEILLCLPEDAIRSIDHPKFISGEKADKQMSEDEPVIGLKMNGEAKAYPLYVLSAHEIVNDVIADKPIAITWCPLCFTGVVYIRDRADGEPLEFGVSGKLWKNALLMYDRQTHSLWSHITGEAIAGTLKGKVLKPVPSTHTTWKEWKQANPSTVVLSKGGFWGRKYDADPYQDYYADDKRAGMVPLRHPDERIHPKEHVAGVKIGPEARAYPFSYLEKHPVVNDEMSGKSLVVVFSRNSKTATVFDRKLGDSVLTFAEKRGSTPGVLLITDNETGSLWHSLTGEAVEGELRGKKLEQIPNMISFWFAWKDYFPDTAIFQGER